MRELTDNVRAAALALQEAIDAATSTGYRVAWPGSAADLNRIAISETSRVRADVAQVPVPTADVVVDIAPPAATPPAGGARRNRS